MTQQIKSIVFRTMTFFSMIALVLIMTAGDLHAQQGSGQQGSGQQGSGQRGSGRQGGQQGARRGEQMMKRLVEDLDLSQDQETRIREITTDAFAEVAKKRDTYGGDRDAMMEASRDLITTMNKDIEEVLSEEQQAKFREMRRDFRRQRGGQGKGQQGQNRSQPSE